MKIIFFGSSTFSCRVLQYLRNQGQDVCAVVTVPARPAGRGLSLRNTDVKSCAENLRIPVFSVSNLQSQEFINTLKAFQADLFLVASYGKIIPREILACAQKLAVGIHPSLLPFYRGSAPINWALLRGDLYTGVTFFKVNEQMDAGDIIMQERLQIADSDDYPSLTEKLLNVTEKMLPVLLDKVKRNVYSLSAQDYSRVTFAVKITNDTARIDWGKSAAELSNLIRGLRFYPSAFCLFRRKRLKILKAVPKFGTGTAAHGEVIKVGKDFFEVATGKGNICIYEVQLEGRKIASALSFLNGHRVLPGEILE